MASGVSGVDSLNPLNLSTSSGGGAARSTGGTSVLGGATSGVGTLGIVKILVVIAGVAVIVKILKKGGK